MALTIPQIPNLNVILQGAVTGMVYQALYGGTTLPSGTAYAGIFAPGALIQLSNGGGIYRNVGTSAVPNFVLESGSVSVSLTAAQIIAMYTTPVEIVPAVAGKAIIVDSVDFVITRTSTQFTGGGVVNVQYNNTANGAGTKTHADIAATVVTGAAGTTYTARIPLNLSDIASASIAGIGLFISNQTAVFAAGTGTAVVTVKYHLA